MRSRHDGELRQLARRQPALWRSTSWWRVRSGSTGGDGQSVGQLTEPEDTAAQALVYPRLKPAALPSQLAVTLCEEVADLGSEPDWSW